MRELFDEAAGKSPLDPEEAVRRTTRAAAPQAILCARPVSPRRPAALPSRLTASRSARLPAGRWWCRRREIADAIAAEWKAQQEFIDPLTMPLTRFANSVVEAVVDRVDAVTEDIAKYFQSDLLVLSRRPSGGAGRARGRALGSGVVLGGGCAGRAFHSGRRHRACAPAGLRGCGGARGAADGSLVDRGRCMWSRR